MCVYHLLVLVFILFSQVWYHMEQHIRIIVCFYRQKNHYKIHALVVTGVKNGWLCGLLVNICLYGFGVAFVITTAINLRCVNDLSYRFLS